MTHRQRGPLLVLACYLAMAAPASAEGAWVLWRHFISVDNPKPPNDALMWQSQPGTKTKEQCESAAKGYREKDPDKPLVDSNGHP